MDGDFDFAKLVNAHSDKMRRQGLHEDISPEYLNIEEILNKASLESVKPGRKKINKKEIMNKRIRRAIIAILLVSSMLAGAKINQVVTYQNDIVISVDTETKKMIDGKIQYYQNMMGIYGESNKQIEVAYGRNPNDQRDPYVDYRIDNFADNVVEASKISDVEVRCLLCAGFILVNEQFRDKVLSELFVSLAKKSEISQDWLKTGSAKEFLKRLGYDSWDDYQVEERKNIEKLQAINDYIENDKGRKNG